MSTIKFVARRRSLSENFKAEFLSVRQKIRQVKTMYNEKKNKKIKKCTMKIFCRSLSRSPFNSS